MENQIKNMPPVARILLIELWDNGKIIIPNGPAINQAQMLTINELLKIKALIELIIDNPDNFHIVKPNNKLSAAQLDSLMKPSRSNIVKNCLKCGCFVKGDKGAAGLDICYDCSDNIVPPKSNDLECKVCNQALVFSSKTEQDNLLCFKCEIEQILDASKNTKPRRGTMFAKPYHNDNKEN